jgi:hypothetical protein
MEKFELNLSVEEGATFAQRAQQYRNELERYIAYLKENFNGNEQALLEEEKIWISKIEEFEGFINDVKYKLPDSVIFDGIEFPKTEVAKRIRAILDNTEIQFSFTLGYYEVYKFWKSPNKNIKHKVLEATLNSLGGVDKYKGFKEWENILVVDSYFKPFYDTDYQNNNLDRMMFTALHNAVLDELKLLQPVEQNQ